MATKSQVKCVLRHFLLNQVIHVHSQCSEIKKCLKMFNARSNQIIIKHAEIVHNFFTTNKNEIKQESVYEKRQMSCILEFGLEAIGTSQK